MSVLVRVQHHPSRVSVIPRLLLGLQGLEVEVIEHFSDPPNPWGGYQECLNALPDTGHVLVIQDDAVVCKDFPRAVREIARANPLTPVCLYLGGLPATTARQARKSIMRGQNYVQIAMRDFVPVVAVLWPVSKARELLTWAGKTAHLLPGTPRPRSDDAVVGAWARWNKEIVRATLPSLVQHPDDVESTIKKRHRHGRDGGRTALYWVDDLDPLSIRW